MHAHRRQRNGVSGGDGCLVMVLEPWHAGFSFLGGISLKVFFPCLFAFSPLLFPQVLTLCLPVRKCNSTHVSWQYCPLHQAIAINQAWFGSPGQLLMSRDESQHPDAQGFLNYSGALQAGDDLKVEDEITVAAAEAWCATDAACEGFTYNSSNVNEAKKKVYFKTGITLNYDKAWSTYIKGAHAPPGNGKRR